MNSDFFIRFKYRIADPANQRIFVINWLVFLAIGFVGFIGYVLAYGSAPAHTTAGKALMVISLLGIIAHYISLVVRKRTYYHLRVKEIQPGVQASKNAKQELFDYAASLQKGKHAK